MTREELKPCPFCGCTPDADNPNTFQCDQGTKWGYVCCCCRGPEVRTGYGPVETWRDAAIEEWNRRAALAPPAASEPKRVPLSYDANCRKCRDENGREPASVTGLCVAHKLAERDAEIERLTRERDEAWLKGTGAGEDASAVVIESLRAGNERLREALREIVKESNAFPKTGVARMYDMAEIAHRALGEGKP